MRGNVLRTMALIALIPLLFTGCLFGPEPIGQEIDPPPDIEAVNTEEDTDSDEVEEDAEEKMTEDEAATSQTQDIELYFKDPNGYVVPYTVSIAKTEGLAKAQLEHMVQGGPIEEIESIPEGFTALIPEGTEILGLDIKENGVANVDLSKEFLNYKPEDEEKLLGAITWALTAWDSIDQVNIWINGHPLEEMPQANTPAKEMTRENTAINIEVATGVQISDSMPVTLYFLSQAGEATYFVPVTRMVARDDDVVQAAMEELVAGPLQSSQLNTEILNNVEINEITVKDGMVFADFGEQLLEYGQENTASDRAIRSIVLSLTENTGIDQVQISVEGNSNVMSKNASLAEPVTRPTQINPIGL